MALPHIERARAQWQARAIEALKGNQSLPGCILIAALHKSTRADGSPRAPSVGHQAWISAGGHVVTKYVSPQGQYLGWQAICTAQDMIDTFKRVADTLKFSDDDRKAMFTELRRWITKDMRPAINQDFEPIPDSRKQN